MSRRRLDGAGPASAGAGLAGSGAGTERPLLRVLALARPLRRRFGLSALLGSLAVGASVALMATSGYLISQASLRPQILSLAVAIVAVRFFGISRGVFRYAERLVAHGAALRLLGRLRVRFYERLEPLVPAGLPETRAGDLLSRFVADVEALQHVYLRAVGPPVVALAVGAGAVAAAALFLPQAGLWLALGLLAAALGIPAASSALARSAGRRQAPARAALSTEVVELVAAAPELVAFGRADAQLARVGAADAELARIARRDAAAAGLGEGAASFLTAATTLAVLVAGVRAVDAGALRGVLLAAVVLLATAAFEAVRPLPDAAQHLAATSGAAARLFALTDREPPVRDPAEPAPPPEGETLRLEGARLRYADGGPWVLDVFRDPAARLGGIGRALLVHTLLAARDSGLPALSLVVSHANTPARRLYDALGFVVTSESRTLVVSPD